MIWVGVTHETRVCPRVYLGTYVHFVLLFLAVPAVSRSSLLSQPVLRLCIVWACDPLFTTRMYDPSPVISLVLILEHGKP